MTLLVFLIMSLIGGANAALVKFAVNDFSPIILVALRSTLAALIITPLILRRKSLFKLQDNYQYLLIANVLFAGNWLFFATGIQYTSVIVSSIIYVPAGLIVAIFGCLFLKEKLTREQIFGLILSMVGMTSLIYGSLRSHDILSWGTPFGNFLIILGLLDWSFYLIVSRKISKIYSPLSILFFNFVLTAVVTSSFLIFFKINLLLETFSNAKAESILALFALAIFSSVMFFYLYQWLIKHTSAFISSLVLYPGAVIASITGVIFYDERLSLPLIISTIFIILGIFFGTSYQHTSGYFKKLNVLS